MRHRVVPLDRRAARAIDPHGDVLANRRRAFAGDEMNPGVAGFPRILDFPGAAFADHLTLVANLSAHLRVENGVVENDAALLADIENRFDIGAGVIVFVAEKIGRRLAVRVRDFDDAFLLRLARARRAVPPSASRSLPCRP